MQSNYTEQSFKKENVHQQFCLLCMEGLKAIHVHKFLFSAHTP